ncbi:phosphoribosyl-AMP cyclohydrolase [Methyloceanibacter caenitepidi]|uniref:Phosphoribosyl-AMP cyclohydrolase n=1 Tax=Methyloceanibacter caenitepidi TaxID=1384459 RepID=A0A0A8K4H5_9HYPH|nr:phosphoribosyl-AMP cyclohydrolase [Methyloceanibacter caenitepidi]BAQ17815.1 phosphoribosyl-AMP cyclohydrolase [Methyloceanibacter caenitepidi]
MTDAQRFPTIADKTELEEGDTFAPAFDADGLVPAIVTAAETGEVLMFAYMNDEALDRTIETGEAHFWSRSRKALWRKGETSGNTLRIVEMRVDCDQDVLWLTAEMTGAGACCHTGRVSCFYRRVPFGKAAGRKLVMVHTDRQFDPAEVYGDPSPKTKP